MEKILSNLLHKWHNIPVSLEEPYSDKNLDQYDNFAWIEGDLWYGWTYSPKLKSYYFNDEGFDSITDLWIDQFEWERQ